MALPFYIAEGFKEDCKELIHTLTERHATVDWQKFCACWKEMEFDLLFFGREFIQELVELAEEMLHVARFYLVTETDNFEDQVIGLFIAYAITLIQPYKNICFLRLVPYDVPALKKIEAMARRDNRRDILVILGKMYLNGKVQFHLFEREHAMDISICSVHVPIQSCRGLFDRDMLLELDQLAEAEAKYMDLKRKSNNATVQVFPGTIVKFDTFNPDGKRIADSLRKRMSSESSSEEDDGESYMRSVKQKAMKKTVDSIRHLNSVADRKKTKEAPVVTPKKTTPKASKRRAKLGSKVMSSPSFYSSPTPKTRVYEGKASLPSLDDPLDTEPRIMDREGSPEVPFKRFTKKGIQKCNYNTSKQEKGIGKPSRPLVLKGKSPRSCGKRELNITEQNKKKRKSKNKLNAKLKLLKFFNKDSNESQTETCQGKEVLLQSEGITKHLVGFEVDDIVIRAEKDAPLKDVEIEYIDNYTGVNALYNEIFECSDDEDKGIPIVNKPSDVVLTIEEFDRTNDDNMQIFDVVSENMDRSSNKNTISSFNDEVDDTMHNIFSKASIGVNRRKCKQPYLRSKFKKLGILPVANFENKKKC